MPTFIYTLCISQGATYTQTFQWLTGGCCVCGTVGASGVVVGERMKDQSREIARLKRRMQ